MNRMFIYPGEGWKRLAVVAVGLLLVLGISAAGCAADPVSTSVTNNAGVPVSFLFEHDGCRVYRFEDVGRYHWYVRCLPGETVTASTTENCGKNCTRPVDIQTLAGGR